MDGRDLLYAVCPNYTSKYNIWQIINELPTFISKAINAKGYQFYGAFQLGAVYDLSNFENMLLVSKISLHYFK